MLGDDEGPLCHFEVDEHGEIHQCVDSALAVVPYTLADWQQDLLQTMYREMAARDEHTLKVWRRHLRLVEPAPEEPVRSDWERTLDEIRADWRKRDREQLLSEQRLNEVSSVNVLIGF